MNRLFICLASTALIAVCACRGSQPVTPPPTPPPGQTFVDVLAGQLKAINYQPIVTRDGERVTVRVRVPSADDVYRAMCRTGGWPFGDQVVRFDETLRGLRQEGVKRISIVADTVTVPMQISQQGECKSAIEEVK